MSKCVTEAFVLFKKTRTLQINSTTTVYKISQLTVQVTQHFTANLCKFRDAQEFKEAKTIIRNLCKDMHMYLTKLIIWYSF